MNSIELETILLINLILVFVGIGFLLIYQQKRRIFSINEAIERLKIEKTALELQLEEKKKSMEELELALGVQRSKNLNLHLQNEGLVQETEALRKLLEQLQTKQEQSKDDIIVEYYFKL